MKQHVTIGQLNELSDKGKEKLKKWYPYAIDVSETRSWALPRTEDLKRYYEGQFERQLLLSIGQMIEFLHEYYKEVALGFDDSGVYWHVHVGIRGAGSMLRGFGTIYDSNEEDKELVDALWEAVKEVLEK